MKGNKFENVYSEVRECEVRKSGWGKRVKTTKHNENAIGGVVEVVEKRRCVQCGSNKELGCLLGKT